MERLGKRMSVYHETVPLGLIIDYSQAGRTADVCRQILKTHNKIHPPPVGNTLGKLISRGGTFVFSAKPDPPGGATTNQWCLAEKVMGGVRHDPGGDGSDDYGRYTNERLVLDERQHLTKKRRESEALHTNRRYHPPPHCRFPRPYVGRSRPYRWLNYHRNSRNRQEQTDTKYCMGRQTFRHVVL